tara:strand:+ start:1677 stop:2690 length:1014 start_codon:yes stop_codon:yes gene_type:complete
MHKILALSTITGFLFLLTSITSIAFEDKKIDAKNNIVYEIKSILDDYVLSYCSTYDAFTINRLYSQKKILNNLEKNNQLTNKLIVSIKNKPINPNLIKSLNKEVNLTSSNFDLEDLELNYLSDKKKEFVKTLLPLISYENNRIYMERSRIESIKDFLINFNTLNKSEMLFLEKMAKRYKVKTKSKHKLDIANELLEMVDIIPNSIVLAQAANESGWGTSRFAREYNALFGEYTYDFSNGVVPLLRENGEKHLVKAFDSVDKSVQSYFNNLNSHYAYKDFRSVRKVMRENNNFNNIKLLVNELDTYAADKNYINIINSIIDINKLNNLDKFNYSETKS